MTFAVTLSDLIEKGGAYAGLAGFFGLAVLSILYFAQAREIRRLRDWAGRAPERAQELEERVIQQAESARRVQAVPSRKPGQPATAAALAAAKAPAVAKPAPAEEQTATEHEVVKPAAAKEAPAEAEETPKPAPEEAATVATAPVEPKAAPEPAANGAPKEPPAVLPPRVTQAPPAVKRPAPAPLKATPPPSRRPAPAAATGQDQPGGRRTGIIAAGILAGLALIVVGLIAIFSGGDDPAPTSTTTTTPPAETANPNPTPSDGGSDDDDSPRGPSRADTSVAVLNGTTVAGLAGSINDRIEQAGYTIGQEPANYTDQARSASVVFYASSEFRTQAIDVAKLLDISDRQPISNAGDAASQLAPEADVVVVVGADQTP